MCCCACLCSCTSVSGAVPARVWSRQVKLLFLLAVWKSWLLQTCPSFSSLPGLDIYLLCSGTNGSTFLLRSAATMQAAFIDFTCTLQRPHQRQRKLCRLCSPYSWRCHPRSRTLGHRLGTRTCHNILHPYSLSFSQPLSLLLLLIFVNVVDHGLREILSLMSSTQFFIPWGDILFVL